MPTLQTFVVSELRKNIDEMSKEERLFTLQKAQQFAFIQPQAKIISLINVTLM
jgi:hypothetical protein